jgi:lipoprotein-anchoring transpeptidase ErfK/SrfK
LLYWRLVRAIVLSIFAISLAANGAEPLAIEIDLAAQKAFLLQDGKVVYDSPISTGRPGHRTPTGDFEVLEKDDNHLSSLYGKIVDSSGNTVVRDADADMHVPKGGKFVQAPMKHFLRFEGANGMHSGYLPGYPASHGCVRMPDRKAALFFGIAEVGTPVRIHGKPPETTPATIDRPKPAATPAPTPPPHKWWQIFPHHTGE